MSKKIFLATILAFASIQVTAQSELSFATYITDGGQGVLNMVKFPGKPQAFTLNALGANGHGCYLEGEIINGKSVLSDIPSEKCTVKFKETATGVEVNSVGEDCHMMYCGMRATFQSKHLGEYLKVTINCTPEKIELDRKKALKFYKEKKYNESLATLEPVLSNCSRTLYWIDKAWIQNDLAVTYAKLNRFDECGKVLADLKKDAELTEDAVKEGYPPLESELYWPAVKAAKTNLKLCKIIK